MASENVVEAYLNVLELGYFEIKEAFGGLPDEHVWKRPAPELVSVGELVGHIAYWEAMRLAGASDDTSVPQNNRSHIRSPLIDHRFAYYPMTVAEPPSEQHLAMGAKEVLDELLRIHTESVAYFRKLNPDLESRVRSYPENYTYNQFLQYASFHIAYHTGQIYSVRHLLGETTPDN